MYHLRRCLKRPVNLNFCKTLIRIGFMMCFLQNKDYLCVKHTLPRNFRGIELKNDFFKASTHPHLSG